MTMRTWLVWEEEYADEGAHEIRATSAADAKRRYRKATGDDDVLLRAAVMTPEIRRARRAELAKTVFGFGPLIAWLISEVLR